MTTPSFVAQDSNSLNQVRYFTPFDPYYYTVDNRPLYDLADNIALISSGGGDSARRATLLSQLNLAEVFRNQYPLGDYGYVTGLSVSVPGINTVRVGPGAFYNLDIINLSLTTQVVKQALSLNIQDFQIQPPVTAGQSQDFLLQIQNSSLISANMGASSLPFLDSTNTFLPGLLLNGELKFSLKAGAAAATGSQPTPTPDSGWTALYVFTATNGVTTPVVKYAANSPSSLKLKTTAAVDYPLSNPATLSNVAGAPVSVFSDGVASSVSVRIATQSGAINPFAPIKVSLVCSASAVGNVAMQMTYLSLSSGANTSGSPTVLSSEAVTMPATPNTLTTVTLTKTIPNTAFASFNAGVWSVTSQKLYLSLSRLGADATDTCSGNLVVHDVIVSQ